MRGKAEIDKFYSLISGITPAYAGKSADLKSVILPLRGSPPPMRGKASDAVPDARYNRITPAYAGKSCRYFFFRAVS